MIHRHILAAAAVAATLATGAAQAATFSPDFTGFAFSGSQFDVNAAANAYYNLHYGITIDNAYLYVDSRDTFDGVGISNGTVEEIGSTQSSKVTFTDTTNFVTIDYLAILATTYSAFGADGALLSTFSSPGGTVDGTFTLSGGSAPISYVTATSEGGFGDISGLTYDYDGTTGGGNTDLPAVPEPSSITLMLAGLGIAGVAARRRSSLQAARAR
jgi:hypothetical protein